MASQSYNRTTQIHINDSQDNLLKLNIQEILEYRELLGFLILRDIKVRYKQTILGASWAILQPFMSMVVFTIFFGNIARIPSDGIPYPVFNFTALVLWTYFTTSLGASSNVLLSSSALVKKVYFPRLILPFASVLGGLVDFLIGFTVLLFLILFFGLSIQITAFLTPVFVLLTMLTSLGFGLWLSVLNVQFRDIRFALPFIIQMWLFLTPVIYPSSLIDEQWQWLYALNPMVTVIDGFRWSLIGIGTPPGINLLISFFVAITILVTGIIFFKRSERFFADVS